MLNISVTKLTEYRYVVIVGAYEGHVVLDQYTRLWFIEYKQETSLEADNVTLYELASSIRYRLNQLYYRGQ